MTVLGIDRAAALPGDEEYARNFIRGSWSFPAAPYEYEIRSPADSSVSTVVPLSSRFDVARAVAAAEDALPVWADPDAREAVLGRLLDELSGMTHELAALQSLETGLSGPDSLDAVLAALSLGRSLLTSDREPGPAAAATGHVLSWGLPFVEVVASCLPELVRGSTVVVKPSLLAPMSAAAFAFAADRAGVPAGVVNVVQGTGIDVGAAIVGSRDLRRLHVRASERVRASARRAVSGSSVSLCEVGGGANVAVAGPGADVGALAEVLADALRVNSVGGVAGLPVVLAHTSVLPALLDAVAARVALVDPAPLASSAHRDRAVDQRASLVRAGAQVAYQAEEPDDVAHRMGWRLCPSVLLVTTAAASTLAQPEVPLGPTLQVAPWATGADVAVHHLDRTLEHGILSVWGDTEPITDPVGAGAVVRDRGPRQAFAAGCLPRSWPALNTRGAGSAS